MGERHRVEPDVSGGEKLALRLLRKPRERHPAVVAADHAAGDQVLRGLAGEELAGESGQGGVVIEERAAGAREVAVRGGFGDAVAVAVELREVGVLRPPRPPT